MDDELGKYAELFEGWDLGGHNDESQRLIKEIQSRAASIVLSEMERHDSEAFIGMDKDELVIWLGPFELAFDAAEIKAMITESEGCDDPDFSCLPKRKGLDRGSDFFG